jgi:hypothetical protein
VKVIHRHERDIPETLRWRYERARTALEAGITWDGEHVTELTQGEAIAVVGEFLDEFETWLKNPTEGEQ